MCGDATLDDGEACDDGNTNGIDGCDACQVQRWTATTAVGSVQRATDAALDEPRGVAVDVHGNIYVVEPDTDHVRKIAPDGSISTIAGTGERGFAGDGGQAASAQLATPWDVAVDGLGNVYVAEATNRRIRKIRPDGLITTIAKPRFLGPPAREVSANAVNAFPRVLLGDLGDLGGSPSEGDAYPNSIALRAPNDLAVDAAGNVLIRRISPAGTITTVAGFLNVEGVGQVGVARLATPVGLAVAGAQLLVASSVYGIVERVADGRVQQAIGRYAQ